MDKSCKFSKYHYSLLRVVSCELPLSYLCTAVRIINTDDTTSGESLNYVWPTSLKKDETEYDDSKKAVSLLAISPVLISKHLNTYRTILTVVNNLCVLGNRNRNKANDNRFDDVLTRVALGVAEMVNAKDEEDNYLYSCNLDRVFIIINVIKKFRRREKCNNDDWRNLMYAISFACDYKSCYYTDSQFERIIDMLIYSGNKSGWLVFLFLNDYVPYMSDDKIEEMLTFASNNDIGKVMEYTYQLSSTFRTNYTMSMLYPYGVPLDISNNGICTDYKLRRRRNYVDESKV